MTSAILGGIGLFMIGMILVTDGLKAAAGDSLRRFLLRFTDQPFKALISGTVLTAIVQSSTATTLATIGFVGAGVITFQQSLGLIFGSNLGTTATAWIVALVGLKFSMSAIALPIVGIGAALRLFSHGRLAHIAMTIAGFGILFVGIDTLQEGMHQLTLSVSRIELPSSTISGRLLLVGFGPAGSSWQGSCRHVPQQLAPQWCKC
jgi:phosphate:Na+ symporter